MKASFWTGNWSGWIISLVMIGSGCTSIPEEAATQISTNAAVGAGELADWEILTPEQRHEAYWYAIQAFHDLDWSLNNNPIPEEFQGEYPGLEADDE